MQVISVLTGEGLAWIGKEKDRRTPWAGTAPVGARQTLCRCGVSSEKGEPPSYGSRNGYRYWASRNGNAGWLHCRRPTGN